MFVSKQTSSSCTKWRRQGDDSSNGKQLHAQSRELRILLLFMKIEAEVKWPQFPPAEKERSTAVEVYWTSYSCTHPLLPGLPQRLISESSPVQKSQTCWGQDYSPVPFAAHTEGWGPGVSAGCTYEVLGTPVPTEYFTGPLSSSWTRICHSLRKIKSTAFWIRTTCWLTSEASHCHCDVGTFISDGKCYLRVQMLFTMYMVYKWLHETKEQGLNFFEKWGGMDRGRKEILKINWQKKQKKWHGNSF